MEIISKRNRIRAVKTRYEAQYKDMPQEWRFSDGGSPHEKIASLAMLDLETCDAEAVNKIIGNDSWTEFNCDECGVDRHHLITIGDGAGYDSRGINVCRDCLIKAVAMAEGV